MNRLCMLRKLAVSVLPAFVLFIGMLSVSTAATSTTHQTVRETVHWTMDPQFCKSIQIPITGTGERLTEINTKVNADGSTQILINDLVTGIASDSTGTYHFTYHNHSTQTIPPSGSPTQVEMVDGFILNGNGSVGHLSLGFNWRWTVPAGEPLFPATWPIYPPTYHLRQLSTHGEVTCDPI